MPGFLLGIGLGLAAIAGAFYVFIRRQGDCDAVIDVAKARDFAVKVDGDEAVVSCLVPLVNKGRQDGMVVELLCEPSHPGRTPGRPKILPFCCRYEGAAADEDDWYWKALLLHRGETVVLKLGASITFRKRAPGDDVLGLLASLPGLMLRIHSKTIGRRSITWRLSELAFPLDRMVGKAG